MILIINIELHEQQAHKQIDDTLEACDMHMYAQKFFNTMETFPWYAKIRSWIGNKKWVYNKLPQFPIYFGMKRPFH
jgi:hypothetical protein